MKYRLLNYLICPACRIGRFTVESHQETPVAIWDSRFKNGVQPDGVSLVERTEIEIEEGILHCNKCSTSYPIEKGIPRLMLMKYTAQPTSGHRCTHIDSLQDISAWARNFDELQLPLEANDFLGRRVLDLGCGYGRHSYFAARYGAEVFAVDHSEDAVLMTRENTRNYQHVHVIQADANQLPFLDASMDRVFTFGVLHHVEEPKSILQEAHRVLLSGGTLSLWVYGPRQGLTLLINNALRGATTNMTSEQLMHLSRAIAGFVRAGSHTPYRMFRHLPIGHALVSHLPLHDHHQWPFDIVVADIYDRLRFPVLHWFRGEELEVWLIEQGYVDTQIRRIVRNNETFAAIGTKR